MANQRGETNVATLFADVHYYFAAPDVNPPHDRFSKGSYIYLFHNANERRGRIEIANHAGTASQDAFQGFLDSAHITTSSKHPTLFTITINRAQQSQPDVSQWHLPAPDRHNQGRYLFPLHTVDLYFWKQEDASQFLTGLRSVLREGGGQLHVDGVPVSASSVLPSTPGAAPLSPVVQQLENVAISTPDVAAGTQGSIHRTDSSATGQSYPARDSTAVAPVTSTGGSTAPGHTDQQSYSPVAYNPAAPAPPEKIAHREKTPPPVDGQAGTGLFAAAAQDYQQPQPQYGQHHPPAIQQQNSYGQQASPQQPQQQYGYAPTPSAGQTPAQGQSYQPTPPGQPLQQRQSSYGGAQAYGSPAPQQGHQQPSGQQAYAPQQHTPAPSHHSAASSQQLPQQGVHQQQSQQQYGGPPAGQQPPAQYGSPAPGQQPTAGHTYGSPAPGQQTQTPTPGQQQYSYGNPPAGQAQQPMQGSQLHGTAYQPGVAGQPLQGQKVQTGLEKQFSKVGKRLGGFTKKLGEY